MPPLLNNKPGIAFDKHSTMRISSAHRHHMLISISAPGNLFCPAVLLFVLALWMHSSRVSAQSGAAAKENRAVVSTANELLLVKACVDFPIDGNGDHAEWNKATWNKLTKLDAGSEAYETEFKILHSSTGIYVLFHGVDTKISTQSYQDYEDIFNGDVFEVFFHPDPTTPVYFEYEVNPLDKELVLSISRESGRMVSWIPWHHSADNGIVRKKVSIDGGAKQIGSSIKSWSAEIFFPYGSLGLLPSVPPGRGSVWNANFCRLDYDTGNMIKWSWSPSIKSSFHELEAFQSIRFE